MIDGELFQTLIKERNVQGVPCVYLNGDLFANGRVSLPSLMEKLSDRDSEKFTGIVDLNEKGEVTIDEFGNTSVEGIYACGDVTNIPYKQIVILMGEGAKAEIAASEYVQEISFQSKKKSIST